MLDADCLRRRLQLHAVEMQMERSDLLQARLGLHVHAVAVQLDVASDLEVILLLTDERVVRVGEVEAFVGVDAEVRNDPKKESWCEWNLAMVAYSS